MNWGLEIDQGCPNSRVGIPLHCFFLLEYVPLGITRIRVAIEKEVTSSYQTRGKNRGVNRDLRVYKQTSRTCRTREAVDIESIKREKPLLTQPGL